VFYGLPWYTINLVYTTIENPILLGAHSPIVERGPEGQMVTGCFTYLMVFTTDLMERNKECYLCRLRINEISTPVDEKPGLVLLSFSKLARKT
jgi:hypothetical protein